MDLSYWAKINSEVALVDTKKQFFGKYLYKLEYALPSALFINRSEIGMIAKCIADRKEMARASAFTNYNSYWVRGISEETDPVMLEHFAALKRKHCTHKYRLDNYSFSIYDNTESALKTFNDDVLPVYHYLLKDVVGPKDAAHVKLLEAGHILGANKNGYKYKVTFVDGKFDATAKNQLINYFDSLGTDVVRLSKATRAAFSRTSIYYSYGHYIHTNDLSILSFVALICPGLIGKTHELTKI